MQLCSDRVGGLEAAEAASHDLHGNDTCTGGSDSGNSLLHSGVHGEVVNGEDDVEGFLLRGPLKHLGERVRAHAGKADLALLFGDVLRFDHVIADLGRFVFGVEIPDVYVVRLEFAEAGVEVFEQGCFIAGDGFGGENELLAPGGNSGADHAFV